MLRTTPAGDLCYLDHGMCTQVRTGFCLNHHTLPLSFINLNRSRHPFIHSPTIQVSEAQRYGLVRAVSYLYSRDFDRLASTFVDLGFVTNTEDPAALEGLGPALRLAFSDATGGGGEGRGESLLDLNFAKLSSNIADVAYRFPIRIPPYWSLVIRCLTILEGKRRSPPRPVWSSDAALHRPLTDRTDPSSIPLHTPHPNQASP